MSNHSTKHDTMVLERVYPADVARVFAAWADPAAKRLWFTGGDDEGEYALDFRVGGREFSRASLPNGGDEYVYDAVYQDIVPEQRIVYTNHMLRNGDRISVSLTSVHFAAVAEGTRLTLTEHGVYLDGLDEPEYRRQGIAEQLEAIAPMLDGGEG
ncbi:SRPBCC family protein [uncultured Leifsonia sp.]|uniref:SRPBCC family protein n=1 Tax=uncultured Leifsonia sp. TaxID=340359 RepID=UPI0025EB0896|nr:SRPBCC family protein [uncultured Leifsonia sp.]